MCRRCASCSLRFFTLLGRNESYVRARCTCTLCSLETRGAALSFRPRRGAEPSATEKTSQGVSYSLSPPRKMALGPGTDTAYLPMLPHRTTHTHGARTVLVGFRRPHALPLGSVAGAQSRKTGRPVRPLRPCVRTHSRPATLPSAPRRPTGLEARPPHPMLPSTIDAVAPSQECICSWMPMPMSMSM